MRIGIDATCWWNQRGFGRFTRQLLRAMFDLKGDHRLTLFVDQPAAPEMIRDGIDVVQVGTRASVTEAAVSDGSRGVGDLLAFRAAVARQPLDVMYFPAVYSWYPTGGKAPTVITFHDAIAEHFPSLVMPSRRGRWLWNAKIWAARRTAAQITTVSNAARAEIVRYLKIDPARIDVVLEAPDAIFEPKPENGVRERLGLPVPARLLLYVGGMAPHKNLLGLLAGFGQALELAALADAHLVLVGDPDGAGFHSHTSELKMAIAADPRLAGRVHFTGYVSDDDLAALYTDATVVAMPAFSEGFGLPAAEALACGTPVIASRGGAVEEVVGPAGLFFDPYDTADIAGSIARIFADHALHAALKAECLPRAAGMSWTTAARDTFRILERVGSAAR